MTTYLYYDPETGEALYTVTGMEPEGPHIEVPADFDITGVRVVDGEVVEIQRTEDDWLGELMEIRLNTSLSRIEFVLAVVQAGIISEVEGLGLIKGEIPENFALIFAEVPLEHQFEMEIRFMGANEIDRLDPMILMLSELFNIDGWQADQIFGITWPEPLPEWEEGQLYPNAQ